SVVVNVDSCVNNPPNADAGPDKEVFENESVVLRGSGSDPDSDPITYSWSCAEGWLSSYNVAQPTYNAPSVDYDRNYTCTLTVRDDNGASDSDSMRVKVINREEENPNLTISKLVRNLTSSSGWQSSMSVNPSDRLEFSIKVSSSGSTTVNGVRIKDILPSKINYQGNLKINDSSSSADIFDSLYLGALYSGQSKNITFRAQVAPESEFRAGDTTQLVNIARTWADGVGQKEDRVTLSVHCPNVLPPVSTDVSIKKLVRNMSDGTGWASSVLADPDEIVSFSIEVINDGSNAAINVMVRDTLPNKISFQNDLKIDDISSGGDIMSGLSIGDLSPGQSKKITFKGMVAPKSQFGVGNTDLINAAVAFNQDLAVSASAKVIVSKTAPTEVITGLTNNKFLDYILLPLLAALAMIFISKKYFVVFSEKWEKWLDEKKKQITEQKSKRILGRKIARIKTRESY
ncbi:DUF11 domain-containing protein, partial [Patescibacteria group bacterium]|nr:DUF11 domain-containing protein [Patescibacteria group bacterium]